jgi:hypothetical protein
MNKPRLLKPDEISCRVQSLSENKSKGTVGAVILLYKDARVDMSILDETFGPMNWQREHIEIGGKMFCTIAVWDEDKKQWVSKQDVGVESNTEATKGESSDSFKRSGTNWGVGRELYTAPFMYIQLEAEEWYTDQQSGKPKTKPGFVLSVKEITYNDNREIKTLVLVDKSGRERFSFGKGKARNDVPTEEPDKAPIKTSAKVTLSIDPAEYKRRRDELKSLMQTYGKTGDDYTAIAGERDIKAMTTQEFDIFKKELTNKWLVAK